ncbi:hypothetical protein KR074_011726 [Drosophila pseudoananassae]|nr:hypothetical protein KR074_011726 [Drosophila pseudoananassae]
MSWNKRNTSHISIYNYPEHLNPFYEDDNHKRLRILGFTIKKKNDNGRHSLSIGNLQDLWKTYSFRKKKSSTLGINKTSESPPTLRRDLNDTSYLNSRIFRGDRHTSLQNIDTRRESESSGMYFNRNDRYRSTTQFSGYSSPMSQNIRSSQSSLTSTNPFESEPDSCPNSPKSPRKYRKKRRAPPPPPPKSTVPDYLATKDIESLASEIEQYVNNRNESLDNPTVEKEVRNSSPPNNQKPPVSIVVTDSENNPSTSKAQIVDVKQTNGASGTIAHVERVEKVERIKKTERIEKVETVEKVTAPVPVTKPTSRTSPVKQLNESESIGTDIASDPATKLYPCTSKAPQCNAIHVWQTNESKLLCTERKQNGGYNIQHQEPINIEKQIVTVAVSDQISAKDESVREAQTQKFTKQSVTIVNSECDLNPSTSKAHQSTDNSIVKLVKESEQDSSMEPEQEKKTNSFGTVKQISQIFEENISSSVPNKVIKENGTQARLNGSKTPEDNHYGFNHVQSTSPEPNDLQIREDFELERPVRLADRYSFDRIRSSISEERDSNATPTPRMRKKKSIKEVLESISRNQKILNESAAKGTKVYMTPSYSDNTYNYPNELNSVNIRSSKEVTSANISPSAAEANESATPNNVFISKITKVKTQYRESSPTSSNLDWNPLPKPSRAHNSGSSNFSNGNVNNN